MILIFGQGNAHKWYQPVRGESTKTMTEAEDSDQERGWYKGKLMSTIQNSKSFFLNVNENDLLHLRESKQCLSNYHCFSPMIT